jgi:PST family polysaccharide transporter/lipopolysaccharide exporter
MIRRRLRAVMQSFLPGGDLATRTARSGAWMTALNVTSRGLELVALFVLARLLTPDDFGLIGIALLVLTGLERFSNLGLTAALIQRREDDVDRYLDTAWTLQIARGVLLAGVVAALAGPAASFFETPAVREILLVVAVVPVLAGLENPGVVYFQKDLEFHKQFVHLVSTSLLYVLVTVSLAFVWGSVWALVAGKVAAEVGMLVVSYVLHDYRPSPAFDREAARELIGYGKWLTAAGAVYFLADEGDDFVVGALLGATALGFYRLAYRVALTPASEVTGVVSTVMFPAYSKLQDDLDAVRDAFFRTIQLTTAITFPMGVGIVVVAPLFVETVLGAQWVPMVGALQVLSVYGICLSLAASFGPVWLALGRPDLGAKIGAFRVVVMAALIYPATMRYGYAGTGGAVATAYLFGALPADLYFGRALVDLRIRRFLAELVYPVAAAGSMGAVVWVARESLTVGSTLLELVVLVALGVVVYAAIVVVFVRGLGWELEGNVRGVADALGG